MGTLFRKGSSVSDLGNGDLPCKMVLLGLGLSLPLVAVAAALLLQADGYFAYVVGDLMRRFREIFGDALIRMVIGLLLLPFLFGLCYTLRHEKKRKERASGADRDRTDSMCHHFGSDGPALRFFSGGPVSGPLWRS